MKTKNTGERVVFVVDERGFDINCARIIDEPSQLTKVVKFKHKGLSIEVPSRLCFDTLAEAKASLLQHLQRHAESIEKLEYDEDNFWVC